MPYLSGTVVPEKNPCISACASEHVRCKGAYTMKRHSTLNRLSALLLGCVLLTGLLPTLA